MNQLPVPRVDEILTKLNKGNNFSLFDFTGSMHQIPVHPDTTPLMAFATQTRVFEWLRVPMGASQSAGNFVRVINEVIQGVECVEAYLDDVVVIKETPEQHVQSMRNFSTDSRLTTSSCLHPQRSAPPTRKFLGHIITPDGVSPNPDKVAALTKMTMSTAPLAPRRSGLLPQLPQEHGQTHQATHRLAPKRRTFRPLTDEMEAIARKLLAGLSRPPAPVFPRWAAIEDQSQSFRLHCDAGTSGVGATLKQEPPNGTIKFIAFISRAKKLDSGQKWTALDLKAAAVVWSIKRLIYYEVL